MIYTYSTYYWADCDILFNMIDHYLYLVNWIGFDRSHYEAKHCIDVIEDVYYLLIVSYIRRIIMNSLSILVSYREYVIHELDINIRNYLKAARNFAIKYSINDFG